MIQVKFKNLEKSELVRETVVERVQTLVEKFPDLKGSQIVVTVEMENSPVQAGPDLFSIKVRVSRGRFDGTMITKSYANFYKALAEVMEHMLEKLNRAGDKERVKGRKKVRQLLRTIA